MVYHIKNVAKNCQLIYYDCTSIPPTIFFYFR